jgi:hypothetical protein
VLPRLNRVCYQSCGEVNVHLHHAFALWLWPPYHRDYNCDAQLAAVMGQTIDAYNAHGAMITAEAVPTPAFAFIHGNWALDDGQDLLPGQQWLFCGVTEELKYLRQLGCYMDVTFPAWNATSEATIQHSIFYVRDDPARRSYNNLDNVRMVEVNQPEWGDLMLYGGSDLYTSIDPASGSMGYPSLVRMNAMVSRNVHVVGRDDWVFVKFYTHGASYGDLTPGSLEWNVFFGPAYMDKFLTDIERVYNDGVNWKLHYVSTREMYNIIKAAEAGLSGDPGQYRDYLIPPYANQKILTANRYCLHSYSPSIVLLEMLDPGVRVELSLKEFGPCSIVEEASSTDSWLWETSSSGFVPSDATRAPGQFGELHFVDNTPSKYYRIRSAACLGPVSGTADFDGNGDVDAQDIQIFMSCFGGPSVRYKPGCLLAPDATGKVGADFDGDGDVDQDDFGILQRCYSGPYATQALNWL